MGMVSRLEKISTNTLLVLEDILSLNVRGICNQHFCPSQEMAQKQCLLVIFVACIFVADTARTALANVTESGRFNRVCDPARFAKFGLNMKEFPYCNSSLPYHVRAKGLQKSHGPARAQQARAHFWMGRAMGPI